MNTSVNTFNLTHTITFLVDKMHNQLLRIITGSGLNPDRLIKAWESTSFASKTWIESGHFKAMVLEIFNPSNPNHLIGRWDLNLDSDFDEDQLWTDIKTIKYEIAKTGLYPENCDYRIIINNKPGEPYIPGWSVTNFRSTEGLTKFNLGTTIGAGSLGSSVAHWR